MAAASDFVQGPMDEAAKLSTDEAIAALENAEIGISPMLPLMALKARREEITPRLLAEVDLPQRQLELHYKAKPDERHENFLHVFSIYLLGLFEEQKAYRPLVRLLAEDTEKALSLLGDVVTEDLHAILARVYDGGDLAPLQAIIEDDTADEFVRVACLKALIAMAELGKIARGDVVAYIDGLLVTLCNADNSDWADEFVLAAAGLQQPELRPKILHWFGEELVEPLLVSIEDIDEVYARPRAEIVDELLQAEHFQNLAEYLSGWAWFTSNDPEDFAASDLDEDIFGDLEDNDDWGTFRPDRASASRPGGLPSPPSETYVRTTAKVGRNDPCPCGSGKKFKKCCLA